MPGTSSAPDPPRYLKDPLEFIRINAIHDRLQEATVNNDRHWVQDRFVTEHNLRKIWNGGLLTGVLEALGYEDNTVLYCTVVISNGMLNSAPGTSFKHDSIASHLLSLQMH
jgi:hypothetical protein